MQADELDSPEEWRPIPWAPMYDVSNRARIRSWIVTRGPKTNYVDRAEVPRIMRTRNGLTGIHVGVGRQMTVTPRLVMREVFDDLEQ